jgi:hypothetical protein
MNLRQYINNGLALSPIKKDGHFLVNEKGQVLLAKQTMIDSMAKDNRYVGTLTASEVKEKTHDGQLLASAYPTELWLKWEDKISTVDTSQDANMYQALVDAGVIETVPIDILEAKVPKRNTTDPDLDGLEGVVDMHGIKMNNPITTDYSNVTVQIPLHYRHAMLGGRVNDPIKDNDTMNATIESVVRLRERGLANGFKGLYEGFEGNTYGYTTDNTLVDFGGAPALGAKDFKVPSEAVDVIRFGVGQLRKMKHYSPVTVMLGSGLFDELDQEPTGLTTGLTLRERILRLNRVANIVEGLTLTNDTAVLIPNSTNAVKYYTSGLGLYEVDATGLGNIISVYATGGLMIVPTNTDIPYGFIEITGLLP